jgi:hypothetical protein
MVESDRPPPTYNTAHAFCMLGKQKLYACTHTQNQTPSECVIILLFYGKNIYLKAFQCSAICALSVLFLLGNHKIHM